uniref:BPI2 domain-containing protein n=1 Tax=Syphacia muris TaxID=451379 RepID=A0A0N5A8J5_9BILA
MIQWPTRINPTSVTKSYDADSSLLKDTSSNAVVDSDQSLSLDSFSDPYNIGSDDSQNCTQNCPVPAGIYFRISQKACGINYTTNLASEALPQLLNNLTLPDVDADGVKIMKIFVEKFDKPKIEANFIENFGVGATVHLPNVVMSTVCEISSFLTTQRGKVRAEIRDLTIKMEVSISRDELKKHNNITVTKCDVETTDVRLLFAGDMSNILNFANSMLKRVIVSALSNPLCEIPLSVAKFFEQQKQSILTTTPPPTTTTSTTPQIFILKYGDSLGSIVDKTTQAPTDFDDAAFYETSNEESDNDLAAKFAQEFCAPEKDSEEEVDDNGDKTVRLDDELQPVFKRAVTAQPMFNPKLTEAFWAPDLTLMYAPKFTSESVTFGLDGGIVYYGKRAENVSRPRQVNMNGLGDKMFGLLITEYVPNTFLKHVYENGFGSLHEVWGVNRMPALLRQIAATVCPTCELHVFANLTDIPKMAIEHSGVRMSLNVEVSVQFHSRWKKHNLITADTMVDVVVKPYVRFSRVYGDIGLAKFDITLKNMGIRGVLANTLTKSIKGAIPEKIWPKIKKRLRFALSQRGIRLPVMCGVELERPSILYANQAIIISTDFSTYHDPCINGLELGKKSIDKMKFGLDIYLKTDTKRCSSVSTAIIV